MPVKAYNTVVAVLIFGCTSNNSALCYCFLFPLASLCKATRKQVDRGVCVYSVLALQRCVPVGASLHIIYITLWEWTIPTLSLIQVDIDGTILLVVIDTF